MSIDETARNCMIRTASRGIWAARKLMDVERSEIAVCSGFTEEELADIEEGREQLTPKGYIALAAFFDNLFESGRYSANEAAVRKLLDTDYADRDIPKYYAQNLRYVFSGMNFLQRWFASFSDIVNQFHKESDKKISDGELEFITENYNILIDSSAVKHEKFPELLSRLKAAMSSGSIFITKAALAELEQFEDAAAILSEEDAVSVFQADGTIKEVFEESIKNRFFLITCNEKQAYDILNSNLQEIRKAPVLAAYICIDGHIALYNKDDIPPEDTEPEEDTAIENAENDFAPEDYTEDYTEELESELEEPEPELEDAKPEENIGQ